MLSPMHTDLKQFNFLLLVSMFIWLLMSISVTLMLILHFLYVIFSGLFKTVYFAFKYFLFCSACLFMGFQSEYLFELFRLYNVELLFDWKKTKHFSVELIDQWIWILTFEYVLYGMYHFHGCIDLNIKFIYLKIAHNIYKYTLNILHNIHLLHTKQNWHTHT